METVAIYLTQTCACSGIFYLLYRVLFEKRAGFRFCRTYLIGSTALAAVIPALRIPLYPGEMVEAVPAMLPAAAGAGDMAAVSAQPFPWVAWIAVLYGVVAAALLAVTIAGLLRVRRLRRTGRVTPGQGYDLVLHPKVESPFSFFRHIFIGLRLGGEELPLVVAHELSHIRHRHSTERIVAEIIKAVLWFNPFAWLAKRSLVQVHEYQADSDVIGGGCDMGHYRDLILDQFFGCTPEVASGLNRSSSIKKRLIMMNKKTMRKRFLWGSAIALPTVAGLMLLFSFTRQEPVYIAAAPPQEEAATTPTQRKTITVQAQGEAATVHAQEETAATPKQEPLFLLDGKEIPPEVFKVIDPRWIESIDVLKDEPAVAAYGEKGRNGVIKITTKKDGPEPDVKVMSRETRTRK